MADQMISTPRLKNEINVNTVIQLAGFAAVLIGLGAAWGELTNRIEIQERTLAMHQAQIEQLRADSVKLDNLAYRVTMAEQSQSQLTRSVEELKVLVNSHGADLRVIKEILGRVERKIDGKQ